MKLFKILPLFISVVFVSCEEVIDISVPDSEQVPVIDATFNATDELLEVTISKTRNYLGDETAIMVTDAEVNLISPDGQNIKVEHQDNGIYAATCAKSYDGEYELQVEIDDKVYTAKTTLKQEVPIKGYERFETDFAPPENVGILLGVGFDDPAENANYYRIRQWKNDTAISEIYIVNDATYNGKFNIEVLFVPGLKTNDSMYVELRSITSETFRYLEAVNAVAGASTDSAAPGNPDSNWDNGALGFFTAYTYSAASYIKN